MITTRPKTIETIIASSANIESKNWKLENIKIYNPTENPQIYESYSYYSSFNGEIISNLFSNLNSLNIIELHEQIKNYNSLGYSTTDANLHLQKIYSLPLYLVLMTIIGVLIMLKFQFVRSKFFMVIIGVFVSVIIYYLNYFSGLFGSNETLPIKISIWLPHVILVLISILGLIKINDK